MSSPLFRQEAMQQLASPEQLHKLIRVTQPMSWVALGAAGLCIAAALAWSVFGTLPTKLSGEGVIIRGGGTFNVVAHGNGVLTELNELAAGTFIRKGQVIGRIAQPELDQQVQSQQTVVAKLAEELTQVRGSVGQLAVAQRESTSHQRASQEQLIQVRQAQLGSLRSIEEAQAQLQNDGLITRQRLEDTRQQILTVQNEVAGARQALLRLSVDGAEAAERNTARQREVEHRLIRARDVLAELKLRRDVAQQVVSEYDGAVLEMTAMRGNAVRSGQPVLSVELRDRQLEAVIYLPANSAAKLLRQGMTSQLSPVTAQRERFGVLLGQVDTVAQFPSSEQSMLALIENPTLVRHLLRGGAPIAVHVRLQADAATRSGFKWSSVAGASVDLSTGTLVTADFVVEERAPVTLVIPLLRAWFGL